MKCFNCNSTNIKRHESYEANVIDVYDIDNKGNIIMQNEELSDIDSNGNTTVYYVCHSCFIDSEELSDFKEAE